MRRWLLTAIACHLGFLAAILAFVFATDVFALFGTRIVPQGVIPASLRLSTSGDRMIKALEIPRIKSPLDLVFIGSSRVVFAFDPASPAMSGLRAYNAGLNGSHSTEAAAILRYVADRGPAVARAVWNVDFEEFFREPDGGGDFGQSGFAGATSWGVLARHALSYEALRKSAGGLLGQHAFFVDVNGFYHYELRDRANFIDSRSGALPAMKEWFPAYVFAGQVSFETNLEERLGIMVAALRYARTRGIAVDVVSMPVHVSRRVLFDIAGLQPKFELWKRRLAEAVALAAEGEGPPVRALDFSEAKGLAFEPFAPGKPLVERSSAFFEIVHPKPIVGDMIVARLLGRAPAVDGFGDALARTATPERLAADRAAVREWESQNPLLAEEIAAVLKANGHRAMLASGPPTEAARP